MRILAGRVNWVEEWGNRPFLELRVDAVPSPEAFEFEQKGELYFAEAGGCCSFFSWRGRPDSGFGGRTFRLRMRGGGEAELKGPWSSNTVAMNEAGFPPCMEADLFEDDASWRGEAGHAPKGGYAVLVSLVQEAAGMVDVGQRYADRRGRVQDFPPGSRLHVHGSAEKSFCMELSGEQLGITGCDAVPSGRVTRYEPAVLLPDGTVWRKP